MKPASARRRGMSERGIEVVFTSPRVRLSDSHILKPQFDPELDALEGFEAQAHHFRTGLAVVAGPTTESGHDPSRKRERTFGMRVLLACGLAFEPLTDRFQDMLVVRIE